MYENGKMKKKEFLSAGEAARTLGALWLWLSQRDFSLETGMYRSCRTPEVKTPTEELVADVLNTATVFSGRLYGSRAKEMCSCVSHARKRLFESRSS